MKLVEQRGNVIFLSFIPGCQLSLGPTWYITLILLIGILYTFVSNLSHFSNQYQRFVLTILCLETVLNLLLVSLMDPGYVLDESDYEDEIDKECPVTCTVCNHHVPYGSEHCQDCSLCVVDRDHHCSWLGKCIGRYNMKYFSSFCFFVVISAVYLGITNFPPLRALIG
ncbi:hypothetical protein WA171_000150, partial [Blastocystis sp. BT1]